MALGSGVACLTIKYTERTDMSSSLKLMYLEQIGDCLDVFTIDYECANAVAERVTGGNPEAIM